MKTFKSVLETLHIASGKLSELAEPVSDIEKRLIDMHQVEVQDYVIPQEHVFKGNIDTQPRLADQSLETSQDNYDSYREESVEISEAPGKYTKRGDKELYQWGDVNQALMDAGANMRIISNVLTKLSKKDVGLHEETLLEGPSDKWMTPLITAIEKHKDKPEFMRFVVQYEAWMETYDRAHKKLRNSKGIEGKLMNSILDAVGISESLINESVKEEPQMLEESSDLKELKSMTPMRDKFGPVNPKLKQKQKAQKSASQNKSFSKVRSRMEEDEVDEAQIRTRARVRNDQEKLKKARAAKSAKANVKEGTVGEFEEASEKLDGRKKEFKEKLRALLYQKAKEAQENKDVVSAILNRKVTKESAIMEKYKPGKLKLKSGDMVTVSKQDAGLLNSMLSDMKPKGRKEMEKVLQTDKAGFEEILGFAREAL